MLKSHSPELSLYCVSRRIPAVALIGIFALVALLAMGCDPGAGVTWVNETDDPVVVYLRDEFEPELGSLIPPKSSKTEGVIIVTWKDLIVVRDQAGNLLLRREITWDELEAQDFRFVIRQEDIDDGSVPSPTPSVNATPTPAPP